jgi:hypothetical protein
LSLNGNPTLPACRQQSETKQKLLLWDLRLFNSLLHQGTFLGVSSWPENSGDRTRGWPVAAGQQTALHPASSECPMVENQALPVGNLYKPCQRYPYFDIVVGLAWSEDPESYAGSSIATGRGSHTGQVKGDGPDKRGYPGPPGWGLGMGLTTPPCKTWICLETATEASEK